MDTLKLIKTRGSIRTYQNKKIPKKILRQILEAGRWGPSIHRIQPWKFVVVEGKAPLIKIKKIISTKLSRTKLPAFILYPTISAITNSKLIIFVYNTCSFSAFSKKFKKNYHENAKIAEISAIAASIQNMILLAESLGIGSCWLDLPLFCKKDINKFLKMNDQLTAVLTLGYPKQKGSRSPRKSLSETVFIIR